MDVEKITVVVHTDEGEEIRCEITNPTLQEMMLKDNYTVQDLVFDIFHWKEIDSSEEMKPGQGRQL